LVIKLTKQENSLETPLKIIITIIIIIVIMAIEVHEKLLLFASAFCCATSLSAFLLSTITTTQQGSSSFLNRSFAIKKGGFFSFPQLSRSLATTVFFLMWFSGIFCNLEISFLKMEKHYLFIY